ncbi:hypothetical protein HDU83_009646 [Entophlyctis luteolus]|nr:hypothetical protein HDU83_009646 [Entophlyctis luteolus]
MAPAATPSAESGDGRELLLDAGATSADCSDMHVARVGGPLPTSLRRLDLSANAIDDAGLTPASLSACTNLTWLDLRANKLSSLAPVSHTPGLQVLNAGSNMIASISSVATLPSLRALIINNNCITVLPDLSPLVNLNTLVLSHNKLALLPKPFPRLRALKKLSLSNNLLTEYPLFTIPPPPIAELRLAHNSISSLPTKQHKTSASASFCLPQLCLLDLGSNLIGSLNNITNAVGLEIVARKDSLVNLTFKGNPAASVDNVASADSNYKNAILASAGARLKVLDGVRFDEKFLQRKEKRKEVKEDASPKISTKPVSRKIDKKSEKSKLSDQNIVKRRKEKDDAATQAASKSRNVSKKDGTLQSSRNEFAPPKNQQSSSKFSHQGVKRKLSSTEEVTIPRKKVSEKDEFFMSSFKQPDMQPKQKAVSEIGLDKSELSGERPVPLPAAGHDREKRSGVVAIIDKTKNNRHSANIAPPDVLEKYLLGDGEDLAGAGGWD